MARSRADYDNPSQEPSAESNIGKKSKVNIEVQCSMCLKKYVILASMVPDWDICPTCVKNGEQKRRREDDGEVHGYEGEGLDSVYNDSDSEASEESD